MINTVKKINDENNQLCGYKIIYVDSNMIKIAPIDTANTDYQAIQEWAKTNTIEEAD